MLIKRRCMVIELLETSEETTTKMQCLVAAGFAPWRVRPHRVRPHIDSSSDQVLKIYRSLTVHDETKSQKTCLFIVLSSIEGDWRTRNRKFRMSSWGRTRWGRTSHGAKLVSFQCLTEEVAVRVKTNVIVILILPLSWLLHVFAQKENIIGCYFPIFLFPIRMLCGNVGVVLANIKTRTCGVWWM